MFDINGWELIIIGLLAVVLIGPDRLPEYVSGLKSLVKSLRALMKQGKTMLNDELGDDSEWRQYDPRQYDPRRIVREALAEPDDEEMARRAARATSATSQGAGAADRASAAQDPGATGTVPAPFDNEAT